MININFRAYSYYIEVSIDQKDWVKVVDYSRFHCRSWQNLYFEPRVVRAIRIVGTHNTVNKVFHVVSMEAYFTRNVAKLDSMGIVGKSNYIYPSSVGARLNKKTEAITQLWNFY